MRYYPFYFDTKEKNILIIGGGRGAEIKVKSMLKSQAHIYIIAEKYCDGILSLKRENPERIHLTVKKIDEEGLVPQIFDGAREYLGVFSCTDDKKINRAIGEACRQRKIPVSRSDEREEGDFILAALTERENLCISVSTGGKGPMAGRLVLDKIDEIIDEDLMNKIQMIGEEREELFKKKQENSEIDIKKILAEQIDRLTLKGDPMKIVVGTRGSNLAQIQTRQVIGWLKEKNPTIDFEIKTIKTKGDIILDVPLHKMNDKGIFVKEIEQALINGEIDMAVHSMKDMPSENPKGLTFAAIPKGEDPRDVLIAKHHIEKEEELRGMVIGTGSKRRAYQLQRLEEGIEIAEIRGNIETRMGRIQTENLDGVVLAAAGIKRGGYEDRISYYFNPKTFIPSPCQGILAIQIRENDKRIEEVIKTIEDEETTQRARAERAFLKEIGGGCHFPVGAYSVIDGNKITLYAMYGTEEGTALVKGVETADIAEGEALGIAMAHRLKKELGIHE